MLWCLDPTAVLTEDWPLWIEQQANVQRGGVSWRKILQSHLQQPKALEALGGHILSQLQAADLLRIRYVKGAVEAWLTIPDSWEPGDAAACGAVGRAQNERDAIEAACKEIVIQLILCDVRENYPASKMRLLPNNWKISPCDLLGTIAGTIALNAQLAGYRNGASRNDESTDSESGSAAMHAPGETSLRESWAAYVQTASHEAEARNAEIEHLLVAISANEVDDENEAGWARPCSLKQMWVQGTGHTLKVQPFHLLRRLVDPRTLLKFLLYRPHMFEIRMDGSELRAFRSKTRDTPDPHMLAEDVPDPHPATAAVIWSRKYPKCLRSQPAIVNIAENMQAGDCGASPLAIAQAHYLAPSSARPSAMLAESAVALAEQRQADHGEAASGAFVRRSIVQFDLIQRSGLLDWGNVERECQIHPYVKTHTGVAQPDTFPHLPAESQASQPQPVQPAAQGARGTCGYSRGHVRIQRVLADNTDTPEILTTTACAFCGARRTTRSRAQNLTPEFETEKMTLADAESTENRLQDHICALSSYDMRDGDRLRIREAIGELNRMRNDRWAREGNTNLGAPE